MYTAGLNLPSLPSAAFTLSSSQGMSCLGLGAGADFTSSVLSRMTLLPSTASHDGPS